MLSVRKTGEALGLLEDLLAIEVLLAADLLDVSPRGTLGVGASAVLRLAAEAAAHAGSAADVHRRLREGFPRT